MPEWLGFSGMASSWWPRAGWKVCGGHVTVWLLFWGLEFEVVE